MLAMILVLASLGCSPEDLADDPANLEFFEREVRPILSNRCQSCHGETKQKGDLRLDSREAILSGGKAGPALVPGKPDESTLVEAINYGDLLQMPPKSKLPAAEIATLTRWVELGAPWPASHAQPSATGAPKVKPFNLKERATHWSFQPIRKVELPTVRDSRWPLGAIDQFLLSALEAKNLHPNPDADKATLIRRVTYDLIGLPPTPDEVASFLDDSSPQAFEKVVERLLSSSHYGERWARHWLDLVRYAETSGHEFDYDILDAWRYRDYVIRALNADLPYDQFVKEHVAGDLLTPPRRNPKNSSNESILGTGFFFLGEGTHSPVDVREERVARVDNQIDVLSKTFLGLTVSCARCHDHKFDAISTKDYYALAGYLKSSRYQHAFLDTPDINAPRIAKLESLKTKIVADSFPLIDPVNLGTYRRIARQVAQKPSLLSDASDDDVVFADFEGRSYEGWMAKGKAFGDGPLRLPVPEYQGEVGAHGKGLVGSHNGRVAGDVAARDRLKGTLTSPEFTINHDFIHFLLGGGSHVGKTCLDLIVDGKAVESVVGRDENRMRPRMFDVRAYRGKKACLRLVDDDEGGWGNISLDHVVFSNQEIPPGQTGRSTQSLARKNKLDSATLTRWVQAALAERDLAKSKEDPKSVLFEDFNSATFEGWSVTGDSFGSGPTAPGAVRVHERTIESIPPGIAHSGLVSDRLQGVLRSRTFTIDHKYIHTLLWGHRARVNVVVDGFEKIRDPIYGVLGFSPDSDTPRWDTRDVSMWIGHEAYLEFADGGVFDYNGSQTRYVDGNGFIAVDEIRFSDSPAPLASPPIALFDPAKSDEQFAAFTREASSSWKDGLVGRSADAADRGRLVSHLIQRGLIAPDIQKTAPLFDEYKRIEETITLPSLALAIIDGSGLDDRVHIRGSSKTLGDPVPRRFLEAIAGTDSTASSEGSGRLELARKMVDPSCPLTARVAVNRLWKHHFGVGLVRTPDDFGKMGEAPSNPDLLDWLATRLVSSGWSLKQMHREMVLSHAYRMSSSLNEYAETLDPVNRLLHRMNVRRLEAESLRDAMLSISGRLDPQVGGPSVPPFLTPFMDGRGRPSESGPMDGNGRRSLYIGVRRNFLTPMLLAFDFPTPASTMGRRNVSNVPAQALTMLNDPFVLRQAQVWADRLIKLPPAERLNAAYLSAFARQPTEIERKEAEAFLKSQGNDPQGWAELCHVLFNVKEFLFVP